MNKLHDWMKKADEDTRYWLAGLARTSVGYIYQLYTGRRGIEPDMAARIEEATKVIHKDFPKLPIITRGELSDTCNACPYYKAQCKKKSK